MLAILCAATSHETAVYNRETLENCYRADSAITIDPQRNTVQLQLVPNLARDCGRFPMGVRVTIKFETQDALYTDIIDYDFAKTTLVDFECASNCGYLATVYKSEVTIDSARYEAHLTPGASTKTRSDFSTCLSGVGRVLAYRDKLCFAGVLSGVCVVASYTWDSAFLTAVYGDSSEEVFDNVASRNIVGNDFELCFATNTAYEELSRKRLRYFKFYETYIVNSDVKIQFVEYTTEYYFATTIQEFTTVTADVRADGILLITQRTDDFKAFEQVSLTTCTVVEYDVDFTYESGEIINFKYSRPFEQFYGHDRILRCRDLAQQDTCAARFSALLSGSGVKYAFAHLVFKDAASAMLHYTRQSLTSVVLSVFKQVSFYYTDVGVEVLYDLFRSNGKYAVGQQYLCGIAVFATEGDYETNTYSVLYNNTCTAAARLILVEYNEMAHDDLAAKIAAAYGMALAVYSADGSMLIDIITANADRVFQTSQRDYIVYASIVMALTLVLVFLAIGLMCGIYALLQHRNSKRKIEIKDNLDEL